DEGLRLLRTDVDGRATFLVHPEDSQAKFSFLTGESERPNPTDQSIVPLKHTIRVLDGFGKSLEVILPKLRDGYIVPDPSFARALALENPDAFFLSQSGECFHNVTVTGGRQRSEGPLSMKRELRDVVRISGELKAALGHQELRILELGRELKELNSLHDRLEDEKREFETQTMSSKHRLQQMDSEMARLTERHATYAAEHQRIIVEQAEYEPRIAGLRTEVEGLQSRQRECEQLSIVAQEQLHELRQRRDLAVQHASQSLARVATLDERHRSVSAVLGPLESLVSETLERVDSLRLQIESAKTERLERENENQALALQVTDLEAACNACEAREGLLQCESEQLRARVAELDEALRLSRQLLDQSRDLRGELSASAAKLHSDSEHMQEQCLNELGVTAQDLLHDDATILLSGDELTMEDQAYREMRARLEGMGPVNMMALEEYQEAASRHTFLDTQRTDLLNSIENTQATIKEIDIFSRQKFEEAFSRINENFRTTFSKLFGGGHAFMRLTDEENSAESGIDVVASPPGKKLQNVLLLSGGEKALTALSLLVGIFQYQPSPFCILDEVDAPLDEANIGRFTELVKEMSLQTQFVLITHSKKTMSIAPVLYGVTMQQPGVSKLVSVRFGATA
ncbi:MAG: chromosome segregation protein SMC, partial [Acidobacteriales bacterium]|nr:chromosome segregation protein SMC [Terriglobales bacterium]